MIAPVALFVYARPEHTRRTINALAANNLSSQTELVIFSDAARNDQDLAAVGSVRSLLGEVSGFKSIRIVERAENFGLAKNIIRGVSDVCEEYGRVIVMEDDLETSSYFLDFMNAALNRYQHEETVWHISGWNYPLQEGALIEDAFFWRVMNCWGWATWSDRWEKYSREPERLDKCWSKEMIHGFNLDGAHDFWSQLQANLNGEIRTWAIFWYATIYENRGLCLNPAKSYVRNIGHDGSGENCGESDYYDTQVLADWSGVVLPDAILESGVAAGLISRFYREEERRRPWYVRIWGILCAKGVQFLSNSKH